MDYHQLKENFKQCTIHNAQFTINDEIINEFE